jgi:plasmid stabilization system protein ParE
MRYLIIFSKSASDDLTETLGWYKEQKDGLEKRFISETSKILKRLEVFPKSFPIVHVKIRKALLNKFPYKILYFIDDSNHEVHVIGVVHQSRHPDFWKNRM